ncbi:MAG: IS21 family transposase [Bacteroidetes bacterium]|nr:IS21 family transposase [Bacteroidota bacterium]
MANKIISMSKIRQVLRMYMQGESKLKISVRSGIARNTIKKYLNRIIHLGLTLNEVEAMSDVHLDQLFGEQPVQDKGDRYNTLKEQFPYIEKELRKRGVTRERLWQEYIVKYPDGYRRSQFSENYNRWLKLSKPSMHMEHKAGDKMYVDYAGGKLSYVDQETGEVVPVEVFVSILGASQLTYVEATASQKLEDFVQCCENALHFYGGVPNAIVPDNLKSAVTKSSKYEPTINETYEHFAYHYSTVVLPARAYKPKDKALVEGTVRIVYQRIYAEIRNNEYYSLREVNEAVWKELEKLNNLILTGRPYSRRQLFDDVEKKVLRPLPSFRFEFKHRQLCTVSGNGHICLREDKHYYSVPYQYIGKKVKILFNRSYVEIFFKYGLIARHERLKKIYGYTTAKEHMASTHQFIADWSPEKFINLAAEIGAPVEEFIKLVLTNKPHPEQGYKSCMGILSYERKVGRDRLIAACSRALDYNTYSYAIIKNILERNLDKMPVPEILEQLIPEHSNIRGESYYQ